VGLTEHVVAADEEVVVLVGLALAEDVGRVPPERRDLDDLAAAEEDVREAEATADDATVAEEPADVVRASARGDVEVLRTAVQEEVTNAAADEVGLEACTFEPPHDLRGVLVDAVLVEGRIVTLETGRLVAEDRGLVAAAPISTAMRVTRIAIVAGRALGRACRIRAGLGFSLDCERREVGRGG
jgi:hypothetical protein